MFPAVILIHLFIAGSACQNQSLPRKNRRKTLVLRLFLCGINNFRLNNILKLFQQCARICLFGKIFAASQQLLKLLAGVDFVTRLGKA